MITVILGTGTEVLLLGESDNFYAMGKFKDPHLLRLLLKFVELNNIGSNLSR